MSISKLIDVKAQNALRRWNMLDMYYDAGVARGHDEHLWTRYVCEASAFALTEAALLKMVKFCW